MTKWLGCCVLLAMLPSRAVAQAQAQAQASLRAAAEPPPVTPVFSTLPAAPAAAASGTKKTFRDPVYKAAFDYPSNWNLSRRDGEISTFHLDARSAPRSSSLRAVAAIPENPFPASTFSGAYVYFSVTPHASAGSCARQAAPVGGSQPAAAKAPPPDAPAQIEIAGIPFTHGHDEQRDICIVQRDEVYTTYRRGACYRFDLAMNNFCGGEVSGVKDVTAQELGEVRQRLEAILGSFRFDPK